MSQEKQSLIGKINQLEISREVSRRQGCWHDYQVVVEELANLARRIQLVTTQEAEEASGK